MPVKDLKIYTGAAEGWVSIVDLSQANMSLCGISDVDCSNLNVQRIMVYDDGGRYDENGNPLPSVDPSFVFQDIGASSIGRPPLGSDWEPNTVGWKFNNAGNLLMGESISGGSLGPSPVPGDGDDAPINSSWGEGTIGRELDALRVLFEEGGGGSTPEIPPGEDAGEQYAELNWAQDAGRSNDYNIFSRDGVFSDGRDWSVDGSNWARAPRTVNFSQGDVARQPVKLTAQGTLYLASDGTAFSYDMKSWYGINNIWSGNASYGLRPLSTVFVLKGTAYVYGKYKSKSDSSYSSDDWSVRLLMFNPATGSWSRVLAGTANLEDNLLAFPFTASTLSSNRVTVFTTNEQASFVMGLDSNGTRVTRIDSQGIGSVMTALDGRLPCEGMVYGNSKICAKFDNGTSLSSDGLSWGATSLFPQAANYCLPSYDDVNRWHVCGPGGQPVICYGDDNATSINWTLITQEVPDGDGDAFVAAAGGRVIVTARRADTYLLSGDVPGVRTNKVFLNQTSGNIRSIATPRLVIENAETQEDANNIFVDRFLNSGNLQLGNPDDAVWEVGTIGKALEDITTTPGDKGEDGKGWTGGSYSDATGIVTFTSNDGLGFSTGDLRGAKGDSVKGDDGTSVGLTTVSVDTADCSITPDSSSGSFVADGTGADGTKQYKLDLTLPRPPVVTTSETEPTGGCDGDFWVDESLDGDAGGGGGGHVKAFVNFNGLDANTEMTLANGGVRKSFNVSSVTDLGVGHYDINFETSFPDNEYAWSGNAGGTDETAVNSSPIGVRTGMVTPDKIRIVVPMCYISKSNINSSNSMPADYPNVCITIVGDYP